MLNTKISWATASWNPFVGCSKVSPACDHCYAEQYVKRFRKGDFRVQRARGNSFRAPITWRRPERIFVCSLSDFFHEDILRADRHDAIRVMRDAPQHTYMLLTKRTQNIRPMLAGTAWGDGLPANVWLGVTAENQEMADLRIPALLRFPAPVHFVSCEPLLGPVDLRWYMGESVCLVHSRPQFETCQLDAHRAQEFGRGLDWVIAGGESGARARPMNAAWARALRDHCAASNVHFFFKQWGEYDDAGVKVGKTKSGRSLYGTVFNDIPVVKKGAEK